ncbi:MAG: glycosyltransferase, partial [Gammaproteobacteria bacterium]
LQDLDIGLMPLEDSEWTRGKCAFKMLTYMACGVPVVVSPVGMNAQVLAKGDIGFGVSNQTEWVDALSALLAQPELARRKGAVGRAVVEQYYSVAVLADQFAAILKAVAGVPNVEAQ